MERDKVMQVLHATWPPAETAVAGSWLFRKSDGGGKRVNATSAIGPVARADIGDVEARLQATGQTCLFQVEAETELDTILGESGYSFVDETLIYESPIRPLAERDLPMVTAFPIWPPLQIMRDIWASGGIGPDRVAVMERAHCEKTSILGRIDGRAAGAVYVGLHDACAMIHALEVLPEHRRKGLAKRLIIAAAKWGVDRGATTLALLVTRKNEGAKALYQSLGMAAAPGYHYRVKAD